MKWIPTGSSVSGSQYGYVIFHDGNHAHYAVLLYLGFSAFEPIAAHLVPCDTYEDAVAHGDRFTHCCHRWAVVCERARLLRAGYALVG